MKYRIVQRKEWFYAEYYKTGFLFGGWSPISRLSDGGRFYNFCHSYNEALELIEKHKKLLRWSEEKKQRLAKLPDNKVVYVED